MIVLIVSLIVYYHLIFARILKKGSWNEAFKESLLVEIALPDNPPQRCCLYKFYINKKLIAFKKIRLGSEVSGKSGGYRVICFYDEFHDDCILVVPVHIMMKSKQSDMSIYEKNV